MRNIEPLRQYDVRMIDAPVGHASYSRPGIVSETMRDGTAIVYLLSTKNYSERGQSFCVSSTHPDFAATGLDATSYTIHPFVRIPIGLINSKRGSLTGELLKEFQDWEG